MLWDYLSLMMENWNGEVIIMRDFNEVRKKAERFGLVFNVQGADALNMFISNASLEEVPLGGCSFTWCHKFATRMSKLDRFLISESILSSCPNISVVSLDLYLYDHRLILMRESYYDYGNSRGGYKCDNQDDEKAQIPERKDSCVEQTYKEGTSNNIRKLKVNLAKLDVVIDKGKGDKDVVMKRTNVVRALRVLEKLQSSDDCEIDKSPGPDGFTFDFYRRYWKIIESDVVDAWNESNNNTIVYVLDCFHHASGLRINMSKSKLLGICVDADKVDQAAREIGYVTLQSPVKYLMSRVGGLMSPIHGGDGKNGKKARLSFSSLRLDVIHEVELLKDRGIDLTSFIHKNLRNGADTLFWEDAWQGGTTFRYLYPRLYALESSKNIDVASKMSHCNLGYSFRRDPRGGAGKAYFDLMLEKVEEVASKTRWIKVMPIKVNVHAWRVNLDILPTRINISHRGLYLCLNWLHAVVLNSGDFVVEVLISVVFDQFMGSFCYCWCITPSKQLVLQFRAVCGFALPLQLVTWFLGCLSGCQDGGEIGLPRLR
nr:RNA-directed DNA polymerase, eukaryota [Tanacetum cinerariifolium]